MTKKAVLINDLSGLGKCSLTASIAVLSVMGIQPCPMPTAVLTNQTGYPSFYCNDCTDSLDNYKAQWKALGLRPQGIYTGFLSNERQADKILAFIEEFDSEDVLILVDPVMGDNGKRYSMFSRALAEKMKELVCRADIITPNLTECCILCGCDYEELRSASGEDGYLETVKALAQELVDRYGVKTVVVTGIIQSVNGCETIGNLALSGGSCFVMQSPVIGESYSGTGDLFASAVFGGLLKGQTLQSAVNAAVEFLEASLRDAVREAAPRNDGIEFEKHLSLLL